MLAILFQEKTKKMLVFPKNAEKNASIIEKGLDCDQLKSITSQQRALKKTGHLTTIVAKMPVHYKEIWPAQQPIRGRVLL